jgi:hypothetical protein
MVKSTGQRAKEESRELMWEILGRALSEDSRSTIGFGNSALLARFRRIFSSFFHVALDFMPVVVALDNRWENFCS